MTATRSAAAYVSALPAHRRKKIAEVAISHVLASIGSGARPDGLYERHHLELAIRYLRRGYYQHAWTEGLLAEARMPTERPDRSSFPKGILGPPRLAICARISRKFRLSRPANGLPCRRARSAFRAAGSTGPFR